MPALTAIDSDVVEQLQSLTWTSHDGIIYSARHDDIEVLVQPWSGLVIISRPGSPTVKYELQIPVINRILSR